MPYIQIFTTTGKRAEAEKMSDMLIKRRLAGCVQVFGPITSEYRWKGKLVRSQEFLCIIKTKRSNYKKVEAAIRGSHSYTVPEILAMPVVAGNPAYLSWLAQETR